MPAAGMAQSVEHILGKDEVISSILITSSILYAQVRTPVLRIFRPPCKANRETDRRGGFAFKG